MLLSFPFCKFLTNSSIYYVIFASWNFLRDRWLSYIFSSFFWKKSLPKSSKDTATGLIVAKDNFDAILDQKHWEKFRFFSPFQFVKKELHCIAEKYTTPEKLRRKFSCASKKLKRRASKMLRFCSPHCKLMREEESEQI